jgi:hypothetical protein
MQDWLCSANQLADEMYAMHDGKAVGELQWACCASGPIHASGGTNESATCYGCKQALEHVRSHKRSRLGTTFDVRSFYRHKSSASSHGCGAVESMHHKAAKDGAIKYKDSLRYHYVCKGCNTEVPLKIPLTESCTAREEITWHCPRDDRYQLDVGFVNQSGAIVGAVEIYHKHEIGSKKASALTLGNMDWCEVTAKRILDAIQQKKWNVKVVQCGLDVCCDCVERLRREEFDRLDKVLADEMLRRSVIHSQRKQVVAQAKEDWFKLKGIQDDEEASKCVQCGSDVCCDCVERLRREEFDRLDKVLADEMLRRSVIHSQRKQVVAQAKEDWFKLKGIPDDEEDIKWTNLKFRVLHEIIEKAKEYGFDIDSDEVSNEIENRCESLSTTLTFGKYKTHTVEEVAENDWPYTLWLAGHDFGRLTEKCKPFLRRADGPGVSFITQHIEEAAKAIIKGRCFGCSGDIEDPKPWKHVCRMCFVKHKKGIRK